MSADKNGKASTDILGTTTKNTAVSTNETHDLTVLSTAALFVADVVGTGILALPYDVRVVLGSGWGILFLMINLPINIYAGYMLNECATGLEEEVVNNELSNSQSDNISEEEEEEEVDSDLLEELTSMDNSQWQNYQVKPLFIDASKKNQSSDKQSAADTPAEPKSNTYYEKIDQGREVVVNQQLEQEQCSTAATIDFIEISGAIFGRHSKVRVLVICTYYANLILVLGNYVLVMSHSVQAMIGKEKICIPSSGLIASTLMFAFSQLDSMAKLGRMATVISLVSLVIVVAQCLVAATSIGYPVPATDFPISNNNNNNNNPTPEEEDEAKATSSPPLSVITTLSALSSIVFALGSQKLFLNIRHDMLQREKSVISLSIALVTFVAAYITVCLLAGSRPPKFLFDAIPNDTAAQRLAGLFLWIHVAVSYAINSQALCSSVDHLVLIGKLDAIHIPRRHRWICLTLGSCVTSYVVANAVPFFQDLTSLIGALTSVPLSLFFPAVLYRKYCSAPLCCPTLSSFGSYALMVLSGLFICCGLVAAISSIEIDWVNQKAPFSCH
jgi:amino acid permease